MGKRIIRFVLLVESFCILFFPSYSFADPAQGQSVKNTVVSDSKIVIHNPPQTKGKSPSMKKYYACRAAVLGSEDEFASFLNSGEQNECHEKYLEYEGVYALVIRKQDFAKAVTNAETVGAIPKVKPIMKEFLAGVASGDSGICDQFPPGAPRDFCFACTKGNPALVPQGSKERNIAAYVSAVRQRNPSACAMISDNVVRAMCIGSVRQSLDACGKGSE